MIGAFPPGFDSVAPFWDRVYATVGDADWGGLGRHQRRRKPIELQSQNTADCHPDRPHIAHGLCMTCYNRVWRAVAG